jgi:plastocyanin
MIRRVLTIAAGVAAIIALLGAFAACGGSGLGSMGDMGEMHRAMHGGGSLALQTPMVSDAPEVTIEIRDFDYFPRELTVAVGTSLTWVNRDSAPHDATDEAGGWATKMLNQGESATLTFDAPGAYRYLCTIHPDMKATLTVG